MSKRRPGTELNHDNWNEEEEPEEKGEFRMASESELKGRVIKTAKRRNPSDKPASSAMSSVFGGFSGFTAATPAAASKPAPSSIFAFLSQPDADKKKDDGPVLPVQTNSDKPKDTPTDDKEYHQKLRALNQSLLQWIKQHVDKDPICILTPVFKDYEKHLQEIQSTKGATTISTSNGNAKASSVGGEIKSQPTSTFGGFSFGNTSTTNSSSPFSTTPSIKPTDSSSSTLSNFSTAPKISFGANSSTGSLFSTSTTTAIKSPETNSTTSPLVPSASTGFSFGGAKPFSFGSTAPVTTTTTTSQEAGATEEDDEDQPPKVEFKAVVEEDSVYSKRCKVFFKVDGNFQERGIGTMFVKPVKDSQKHQMIVRADTSLGNILVNLVLVKGLPVQKMGTNNVMLVCIPNADFDKPVSVLLKVKTAGDAEEVIERLKEYSGE